MNGAYLTERVRIVTPLVKMRGRDLRARTRLCGFVPLSVNCSKRPLPSSRLPPSHPKPESQGHKRRRRDSPRFSKPYPSTEIGGHYPHRAAWQSPECSQQRLRLRAGTASYRQTIQPRRSRLMRSITVRVSPRPSVWSRRYRWWRSMRRRPGKTSGVTQARYFPGGRSGWNGSSSRWRPTWAMLAESCEKAL